MTATLQLKHRFDLKTMRHFMNDEVAVLHCHHYATLYTQLAIDAKETDLLFSTSEDAFGSMLSNYYLHHDIMSLSDKIDLGCQLYAALGLGKMNVTYWGSDSGQVVLTNSHVDQGWIKKWGLYDAPVNYITSGYIAGMFNAISDCPAKTFTVREIESIVMGAKQSTFKIFR